MEFSYFSRNGELLPLSDAKIPLSNIEYQYGFGVYETLRVVNGVPYFVAQHVERLIESALIIGLEHSYTLEIVRANIAALIEKTGQGTYNLKILLVGGKEPVLSILPLNPLFPDKKLYRDGVACVTQRYERLFPHAKTLNMLGSYLAYGAAKKAGAYDALLLDEEDSIVEGTRTNFFCIKGKTIISPPEERILLGVTRSVLYKVAVQNNFQILEEHIPLQSLDSYDGAFLTSTSSGVLPVASIDTHRFPGVSDALKELIRAFDTFVAESNGVLED